ncbi:MAG: hypothetical protein ACO34J_13120 [Prochlorothrix sp.]
MNFRIKSPKGALLLSLLGGIALVPLESLQAHETQVKGSVAAIWHIEPNDAPEAGKPAQVRVALTRAGGEIIPLADCNCTLKIWADPKGEQPLFTPDLKAISAEQYTGIPAADVVFPQRGHYTLELIGTPKEGADFEAFDFTNEILVATGTDTQIPTGSAPGSATTGSPDLPPAPPGVTAVPEPLPAPPALLPWILLGTGFGMATIVAGLRIWGWKKNSD